MKKQIITSFILCGVTFWCSSQNLSQSTIQNFFPLFGVTPIGSNSQLLANERFRFQSGAVTQLDTLTTNFTFNPTDTWFTFGRVNAGSQSFYGSRFQNRGKALVMGFSAPNATTAPGNPRIEWIGATAASAGNLEFRSGIGFGVPGTPGTTTLVASMTPQGNTYFGTANPALFASLNPKVGIGFNGATGLQISSDGTIGSGLNPIGGIIEVFYSGNTGTGLLANVNGGQSTTALFGKALGQQSSIGVFGVTSTGTAFSAAIYGDAGATGSNLHAGFFNGDVVSTGGGFLPSDKNLKQNITTEKSALDKISLLRPVSYQYKNSFGIALPSVNQHGFISQELAEIFPELTKDITQPIFDENGKINSEISYKAINYTGLISVLTAGIQELNTELAAVREELADYKANDNVRSQLMQNSKATNGYSMEQNIPNPFDDRSIIRYQLAPGVERATISIFNLNGGLVRDYALSGNKGEITILASDIGKGMFIYSLNLDGQEILSKRMIVK